MFLEETKYGTMKKQLTTIPKILTGNGDTEILFPWKF